MADERDEAPVVRNLKAWVVKNYQECSEIVFNNHGLAARRIGAEALGLAFDECTVRRSKEFDNYADDGYVPKNVLIEEFGWWFECNNCSDHITEDAGYYYEKADLVYCSRKCRASELLHKRKINRSHLDFCKKLKTRFPELDFKNVSKWPCLSVFVEADIPSCIAPVQFRKEDDGDTIFAFPQIRDVDAFTRWKDSRIKQRKNHE